MPKQATICSTIHHIALTQCWYHHLSLDSVLEALFVGNINDDVVVIIYEVIQGKVRLYSDSDRLKRPTLCRVIKYWSCGCEKN